MSPGQCKIADAPTSMQQSQFWGFAPIIRKESFESAGCGARQKKPQELVCPQEHDFIILVGAFL